MAVLGSKELGSGHKNALVRFAFHADNETGESYVSNETLGKECGGISAQTVSRAMSAGRREGFIYEKSRGGTSTGQRLTSVRRCVFPRQTLVNSDKGTETDPSQNRHRPPSISTMTPVNSDMDPSQNRHGTLVENDYPTNPVTNPLTKPENSASELTAEPGDVGGSVQAEDVGEDLDDEYFNQLPEPEDEPSPAEDDQTETENDVLTPEQQKQWNRDCDEAFNALAPDDRSGNRAYGSEKIPEKQVAPLPAGDKKGSPAPALSGDVWADAPKPGDQPF